MPHPDADLEITAEVVRALVATQHPALLAPIRHAAHGWDNEMFRLGDDLAVRLPRRGIAAPILRNELRWLPEIAARLPVTVPAPVAAGRPSADYPWEWSIVPWIEGEPATSLSPEERDAFAVPLAGILRAMHVPAPDDAPRNPFRGVPLAAREAPVRERLADLPDLLAVWEDRAAAAVREGPDMWIHGDVHPGNLVCRDGALAAVVDFGDMGAGDPACDLTIAWSGFTPDGRRRFRAALGASYDEALWRRARAWAASFVPLSLDAADDGMRAMAAHTRVQLTGVGA